MRVLIVLSRDEYVRNYVETGALRVVQQQHECSFLLTDHCKRQDAMRDVPGFLGTIKTDARTERAHYELFNVLTWRHRKKSRTFYYRFSRMYKTYPYTTPLNILRNMKGLADASKYVALGNRVVARLTIPSMIAKIPVNPDLARWVSAAKPDLVLLPCSAYDPIGNDLARLGRTIGFKTLFLIDNWDNLSSKSIFWAAPDFLGVWGEQSREHAVEIHGFDAANVFTLGTPRFESYYAAPDAALKSHYPFRYVLFCGSALAFDELGALRLLDEELSSHRQAYGELKIVYRPHPWRQTRLCPDVFREQDFKHVVLDLQIRDAYYRRDVSFQPALDYYPVLLRHAEVVVCPLTTMLVEAIICGTRVLAVAYDDKIHYTSPHNAYRFYLHFEGIERIVGLRMNRDAARLGADLRALVQGQASPTREEMNASLGYFIYSDALPYSTRLAHAIDAITENRPRA